MPANSKPKLGDVHPAMVRAEVKADPERCGMEARRDVGQALEWALDQSRVEFKAAAAAMGYTHHGVVTEWIAGRERIQLDKLKVHLPKVYVAFLLALLEMEEGVEVKTLVTLRRVV